MNDTLKHIAIVPDGNRTWAREKGLVPNEWHQEWYQRTKELLEYVFNKLETWVAITFWAMSTENVKKRSVLEKTFLFALIEKWITEIEPTLEKYNLWFTWLGSKEWIPESLVKKLDNLQQKFDNVWKRTLNLLFNYGWKRHIQHALEKCVEEGAHKIDEFMKLWNLPPVDLIIRTKWALRTSWFLPWEDYAERYFTDLKYPDFTVDQLKIAIEDRYGRKRNFGA